MGQNRSFCMNNTIKGFDGCHLGEDASPWSITWPPTGRNKAAKQKCPGGSESKEFAHRKCLGNNQWESPNISVCQTVEILRFLERAKEFSALYQRINSDNSDRTRTFRLKDMQEIIDRLVTVINVEQPVLPNDLPTISSIMHEVILVTNEIANGSLDDADLRQQIWDITHSLADVLNVLFDETNDVSFEQLTYEDRTQLGEQLLDYTEHIGLFLSATLETDADMNVMDNFTHENIVVAALIPTEEHLENRSEIEFPPPQISFSLFGTRTPSMRIPARAVLNRTQEEKKRAPVINIISRNLHLATQEGKLLESLVISGKISRTLSSQINLHEGNASLRFYVPLRDNQSNATCHFFNISRNNSERGHFSQEGITSTTHDGSFVQCSSNHLTSFAILVDVSGQTNDNQSTGLKIVSYIGCAVSIVCLLIAVCMLIAFRKKIFNQEQHFLHLNLSISLLIGLVIFVSGIETASDYRTSCLIVAILLHYFFMAAFSWMLCEGILLFIMLKFVFYHGFLKSKIFFLLLGWGLPLPIVIVSAAVSHEQYGIGDAICWISEENGAIWAFIGPILLIILINSFFLVVTMHEIFKSSRGILTTSDVTKLGTAKSLVRAAIIVVPMLGITWVVGIFAINENTIAFAWIFTILNSFQGMVILFVYVLKNEKFLKMIGIQKCIEKFTRDSHPTSASARPIANTKQTEAGLSEDANIALKSRSTSLGTLCDDNTDL
ncbi:adhesion G protein-coupled receptor L3-like [Dysidea avara]|uniref:adhesion G protein-coupled receptor L3-like n=1 Tax=Dysidea avara TaxID=196820 RepID=UPI003330F693